MFPATIASLVTIPSLRMSGGGGGNPHVMPIFFFLGGGGRSGMIASLHVSGHNLRVDCQPRALVPPLNSGANAAPVSVCRHSWCSVTTVEALMLAVVALKQPAIECLTLGLSRRMNGVTLSYC